MTGQTKDDRIARDRLLHEAERLFITDGFAAVSTRQICAAAGVTQPTMYHHFGNKEALFLAVVQNWLAALYHGIDAAIAHGTTIAEQLHGIALLFWTSAVSEYQAMQRDAMLHMPLEHRRLVAQTVSDTLITPIIRLMQSGITSGELPPQADPVVLTQFFWALVDGINGLYRRGDALPRPEDNRSAIAFFLAGAMGLMLDDYRVWPAMGHSEELFRGRRDRRA